MTNTPDNDDSGIAELLREVGARDEPSAEITQAVQAAVYAEWRAEVQERTRARRRRVLAIAASIAVVAVSATVGTMLLSPKPTVVANIAHVDGSLLAASSNAPLAPRAVGEAIRTGDML